MAIITAVETHKSEVKTSSSYRSDFGEFARFSPNSKAPADAGSEGLDVRKDLHSQLSTDKKYHWDYLYSRG